MTMTSRGRDWILQHRFLRRYLPLVHEDLSSVYFRDLQKWLLIAPLIGLTTGLLITGLVVILLEKVWPAVLGYYVGHHWAIVPGITLGFVVTGLLMQFLTRNPNEHSTEEVIHVYHERQGKMYLRPFWIKILAAITTVGAGGSAALEGPGIYGGASVGSWFGAHLKTFKPSVRDRRIMLICGAAAGMSAVFRAPLTGIVFALEMPYRDDLAHEALLPSLIASVVSYITMGSFLGTTPLFNFAAQGSYTRSDVYWSALLGLIVGLVATIFVVTFRRVRTFFVRWNVPHWSKMALGGFLTGVCGIIFLWLYPGDLIPIGPNYEAVGYILGRHYASSQLLAFSGFKLVATICSLGVGGVSAMFVPLFMVGGSIGTAFAQSIVHSQEPGLYAAVGMSSFISAGYKAPLAAVVFVAEATGGHAFIIPALIGAAIAYGISGDASASGDQRLHEGVEILDLQNIPVQTVMRTDFPRIQADTTIWDLVQNGHLQQGWEALPIFDEDRAIGMVTYHRLLAVPAGLWDVTQLREVDSERLLQIESRSSVMDALQLLTSEQESVLLAVVDEKNNVQGVMRRAEILKAFQDKAEVGECD